MIFRLVAEFLFQNVVDDKILRHRFAGGTALGNDVEHRLFHVDHVEQRLHSFGIDVVFHVELGALALCFGQIVIVQVVERLHHRDGTERRTADTQHHEIIEILLDILCRSQNVRHDVFLVVRKFRPAHHARAALFLHARKRRCRKVFLCADFRRRNALFAADEFVGHIVVVHS